MLYTWERTHGTHCIGGWMGLRAGMHTECTGKILCFCLGLNPCCPACSQTLYWATLAPYQSPFKSNKLLHYQNADGYAAFQQMHLSCYFTQFHLYIFLWNSSSYMYCYWNICIMTVRTSDLTWSRSAAHYIMIFSQYIYILFFSCVFCLTVIGSLSQSFFLQSMHGTYNLLSSFDYRHDILTTSEH
jgi:hypothetical protein